MAAPGPIPSPLPPWARWLIELVTAVGGYYLSNLQYHGSMTSSEQTAPDEWRHIQCTGTVTGSTLASDRFVTTFDIVNITGGAIDSSWTQADYDIVSQNLTALMQAWAAHMTTGYTWQEIRFYKRAFNPSTVVEPFTKAGAPDMVEPAVIAGTSIGGQAPQVAFTSTDKTPFPRHWGRNYWPFPGATFLGADGHATSTLVQTWAQAMHDVYDNLMVNEFFPVVPVTRINGAVSRGLLGLNAVQVDDLFDVIRHRRPKSSNLRVSLPLP